MSGNLEWSDSDTAAQTFNINIINDDEKEGDETAALSLSGATGGATLGSPQNATVTIRDDESRQTNIIPILNLLLDGDVQ